MRLKLLIFLSGWVLLAVSAQADLSFVLSPSVKLGTGSNEVVFIGTLTNTSLTTNLFLNNVQFTFTNTATNFLTANTNTFFANTPGILLSNEVYSDVVFAIVVSAATPRGNYFGTATVLGGTNIFATNNLAGQAFQISLPTASLDITRTGTNLVLMWPSPPAGFVLQQNSSLLTTNWVTVTNTLAFTNDANQVMLPLGTTNKFFRLSYP